MTHVTDRGYQPKLAFQNVPSEPHRFFFQYENDYRFFYFDCQERPEYCKNKEARSPTKGIK